MGSHTSHDAVQPVLSSNHCTNLCCFNDIRQRRECRFTYLFSIPICALNAIRRFIIILNKIIITGIEFELIINLELQKREKGHIKSFLLVIPDNRVIIDNRSTYQ